MNTQAPQLLFTTERLAPGDMQDKATPARSFSASGEPSYNPPPAQLRTSQPPSNGSQPKHHGSQTRKGGQAAGYYTHAELAVFERMRGTGENRLSRSEVVTKLTRLGLAVSQNNEDFAMLEPRIEQTLNRLFEAFDNRYGSFLAKIYYTAKQGELNTEDILRLAFKNDPNIFNNKIQKNSKDAHLSLGDKHKNHHAK
jgi:hypothetical protein